jgi:hypothetical protein
MKSSSNKDMNQVFEYLANIKAVEPNANLQTLTLGRLNNKNIIPLNWVRAVACLFILYISFEYYVFHNKESNKQDVGSYVSITNNILYNE